MSPFTAPADSESRLQPIDGFEHTNPIRQFIGEGSACPYKAFNEGSAHALLPCPLQCREGSLGLLPLGLLFILAAGTFSWKWLSRSVYSAFPGQPTVSVNFLSLPDGASDHTLMRARTPTHTRTHTHTHRGYKLIHTHTHIHKAKPSPPFPPPLG